MSGITWVAFYPQDWLGGTRRLTAAETGVYITLICMMYEAGGTIERDDERLWRACGMDSKKAFTKALRTLIEQGKIRIKENNLSNFRVEKELKLTQKKAKTARASALKRWQKTAENRDCDNANALRTHDFGILKTPPVAYANHNIQDIDTNLVPHGKVGGLGEGKPISDLVETAVEAYNQLAAEVGLSPCRRISRQRRAAIQARLEEDGLDGWNEALQSVRSSPWCRGQNSRGWKANVDFVARASSNLKLREGFFAGGNLATKSVRDVFADIRSDLRSSGE